jgi:hypothetical protein
MRLSHFPEESVSGRERHYSAPSAKIQTADDASCVDCIPAPRQFGETLVVSKARMEKSPRCKLRDGIDWGDDMKCKKLFVMRGRPSVERAVQVLDLDIA